MKHGGRHNRLIILVAIVGCAGCGGNDRLEVNPVRGQVMYRGEGVPNATIVLHPIGETAAKLQKMRPYAYADQQGRFEIMTYVAGDGAPPGDYEVAIIAAAGGDRDNPQVAANGPSLPTALVQKYGNQKTSEVKIRVEPGTNELEPFVLN